MTVRPALSLRAPLWGEAIQRRDGLVSFVIARGHAGAEAIQPNDGSPPLSLRDPLVAKHPAQGRPRHTCHCETPCGVKQSSPMTARHPCHCETPWGRSNPAQRRPRQPRHCEAPCGSKQSSAGTAWPASSLRDPLGGEVIQRNDGSPPLSLRDPLWVEAIQRRDGLASPPGFSLQSA
jgi:hypothetical protein